MSQPEQRWNLPAYPARPPYPTRAPQVGPAVTRPAGAVDLRPAGPVAQGPAGQVLPNPYTPGEVAWDLPGREAELSRIEQTLDRVAQDGASTAPPTVFLGPEGSGKTSLLRSAEDLARSKGYAVAWVPGVQGQPVLADLMTAVERALEAVDIAPRAASPRWDKLRVELGGFGAKVGAEFGRPPEPEEPQDGRVLATEEMLRSAGRATRERGAGEGGAGLLVVLDDLHAPAAGETGILVTALQNLAQAWEPASVVVLGSGLPSAPGHLMQTSAYAEQFGFEQLRPLEPAEAARALYAPARQVGVTWEPEALARTAERAGGNPQLLQLLGSTTWAAASPQRGGAITEAHADRGWEVAQERLATLHRGRWDASTVEQQTFLEAMASQSRPTVPREAIAESTGMPMRQVSQLRDQLSDRGIITQGRDGELSFAVPGFVDHVRDTTGWTPPRHRGAPDAGGPPALDTGRQGQPRHRAEPTVDGEAASVPAPRHRPAATDDGLSRSVRQQRRELPPASGPAQGPRR